MVKTPIDEQSRTIKMRRINIGLINEGEEEEGNACGQTNKGKGESFWGWNRGKIAKMFTKFLLHDHPPLRNVKVLTSEASPSFHPLAAGKDETFRSDCLDYRTSEEN